MKNKVAFTIFCAAFALVQVCMLVTWQRISSKALLCSIVSPASSLSKKWSMDSFMSSYTNRNNETSSLDFNKRQEDAVTLTRVGIQPRAWPKYKYPFPCMKPDEKWWHPESQRSPSHEGLLFVKEMKTGSSTIAGVAIRIARNMARRLHKKNWRLCKVRFDHSSASRQEYGDRNRKKSFLFTIIREPTSRAISQFFHFHVSREKVEPTDLKFKKHLLKYPYLNHYYLRDLSTTPFDPEDGNAVTAVNNILRDYDFIGITERLDESLVALQMILGLETNDLLYLKAKGNGGYDDAATMNRTCQYIVPAFVSPGMKRFFQGKRWKARVAGDELLYKAADASLDLTIEKLGRVEFNEKLVAFRKTLAFAEATCTNVRFPCTESGELNKQTDCLWLDSGCGVHCLDNLPNLA